MNTPRNLLAIGLMRLFTNPGFTASWPTLHAAGQHHYAMLRVPPSGGPVTVKITDGQPRIFQSISVVCSISKESYRMFVAPFLRLHT